MTIDLRKRIMHKATKKLNAFDKMFFQYMRFAILSSVKIHVLPCLAHIQEMHSMKILQDYQMTRLLSQD